MLDAVPREIQRAKVNEFLLGIPGVTAIHDLHIWGLSSQDIALTAHIVVPNKIFSDGDYQQLAELLKKNFNITHTTIQIERGNGSDDCKHLACC
jgi:cobalt-zinc-cadmium efflux system protein